MIGISLDETERERPSESDTQTASTMGETHCCTRKRTGPLSASGRGSKSDSIAWHFATGRQKGGIRIGERDLRRQ